MRAATPERPFRLVQLHAEQCGHSWKTRTARTDEEIEGGRSECPLCRGDLGRQCKRVVTIERVRSLCDNGCGNKLTVYNLTGICGPCETAQARKIARLTAPQWTSLLASQKAAVLSLLPGTFPALIVKAAVMCRREPMETAWRVRGVDIQQILDAAIKAGEVVQWNPDGGRPVYRLVRQQVKA